MSKDPEELRKRLEELEDIAKERHLSEIDDKAMFLTSYLTPEEFDEWYDILDQLEEYEEWTSLCEQS